MARSRDLQQTAWFSGFTDGEACFAISLQRRRSNYVCYQPRFQICLRADDAAILDRLQATFGGRAYYTDYASLPGSPVYRWMVAAKSDLAALVEYFDRFPLQAKKRHDYELWRRAVQVYRQRGGRDPELETLRDALTARRQFLADAPDLIDPLEVQMALEIN